MTSSQRVEVSRPLNYFPIYSHESYCKAHFIPALKVSGLPYSIGPKRLAHDIKTLSVALIPHFLHFQKRTSRHSPYPSQNALLGFLPKSLELAPNQFLLHVSTPLAHRSFLFSFPLYFRS